MQGQKIVTHDKSFGYQHMVCWWHDRPASYKKHEGNIKHVFINSTNTNWKTVPKRGCQYTAQELSPLDVKIDSFGSADVDIFGGSSESNVHCTCNLVLVIVLTCKALHVVIDYHKIHSETKCNQCEQTNIAMMWEEGLTFQFTVNPLQLKHEGR